MDSRSARDCVTAAEARDRASVIRGRLREAMRSLSVPWPDWEMARESLDWAATLAMELARDCMREDRRGRIADGKAVDE